MIINPLNTTTDTELQWRQMREFNDSSTKTFQFREIGGQNIWSGTSTLGFVLSGVAAHGSLVMTICETDIPEGQEVDDWANSTWTQLQQPYTALL